MAEARPRVERGTFREGLLSRQRVTSQMAPSSESRLPVKAEGSWQRSEKPRTFSVIEASAPPPLSNYANHKRDRRAITHARSFFIESSYSGERTDSEAIDQWRLEHRTRTVAMGMILALNLRVLPPGAPPSPRASEEAWMNPSRKKGEKDIELVAARLKEQLLSLCPRTARSNRSFLFKQAQDPSVDKVKAMVGSLRHFAREKRVVVHYNGHGVPRPSDNGELWVFNRELTQYIPLSLFDLQAWVAGPALYIFDCPRGGSVLDWLDRFAEQHREESQRDYPSQKGPSDSGPGSPGFDDYFALTACGANETLPSNPELPADLLTACLTTPIRMSLRWSTSRSLIQFLQQPVPGSLMSHMEGEEVYKMIAELPGNMEDRTTPLGELHWIFTAITEAIAWECVEPALFQKLFREDPVVAGFFRNFLLADKLLRDAQCSPQSYPALPSTQHHPMWNTWDQVLDHSLEQLPRVVRQPGAWKSSSFFEDHLIAFEVWLAFPGDQRAKHPRELPVVLQALLSPAHRLRALELFQQFLDLGVWAVNLSLAIGIFHYVLRLLARATGPSAGLLIFIWTKLVAADHSLQEDLVKADAHLFFLKILSSNDHKMEDRIRSAFILAVIMDHYPVGQVACLKASIVPICASLLTHSQSELRFWTLICLGKVVEDNESVKRSLAASANVQQLFLQRMHDTEAKNRGAALFSIGAFIAAGPSIDDSELDLAMSMKPMAADICPSVRTELVTALTHLVALYQPNFDLVAVATAKLEVWQVSEAEKATLREVSASDFGRLWRVLYSLQFDPMPILASAANKVIVRVYSRATSDLLREGSGATPDQVEALHSHLLHISHLYPSSVNNLPPGSPYTGEHKSIRQQIAQGWRKPSTGHSRTPSSSFLQPPLHQLNMNSSRRSTGLSPTDHGTSSAGDHRNSVSPRAIIRSGRSSALFHRACEGFNQPCLDHSSHSEERSLARKWKQGKMSRLLDQMEEAKVEVSAAKIETQFSTLSDDTFQVASMMVHPFYPVVAAAPCVGDCIRVWDWKDKTLASKFPNGNAAGSTISSMSVVNEMEETDMLLVSSSDGVMRLWSTYYQPLPAPTLVTAWRAHAASSSAAPAMRHLWKQVDGVVLTAGEWPIMRMWDVDHGIAVQDIPTGTTEAITCLAQERPSGPLVVAGDAEGGVRVFDCRLASRSSLVKQWNESTKPLIGVEMMFDSVRIVAGSEAGDVRFFDMRTSDSVDVIQAHSKTNMASLAVHRQVPIIATGTLNQTIKVTNHNGQRLNDIKYSSKYLGQRIGAVSCLQFHPIQPILAAGDTDGVVAIYHSSAMSGVRFL